MITLGTASAVFLGGTAVASADTVTVQAGDTLNKIAEAHDTDVDTLVAINKIENKNLIFVGEKIETNTKNVAVESSYTPTQTYNAPVVSEQVAPVETAIAQPTEQVAQATPAQPVQVATSDALQSLINRESGANTNASNGQYYGIGQLSPQARAMYGGNSTDYNDQLNAMKSYISARYGTAENAWAHSQATGWY